MGSGTDISGFDPDGYIRLLTSTTVSIYILTFIAMRNKGKWNGVIFRALLQSRAPNLLSGIPPLFFMTRYVIWVKISKHSERHPHFPPTKGFHDSLASSYVGRIYSVIEIWASPQSVHVWTLSVALFCSKGLKILIKFLGGYYGPRTSLLQIEKFQANSSSIFEWSHYLIFALTCWIITLRIFYYTLNASIDLVGT